MSVRSILGAFSGVRVEAALGQEKENVFLTLHK